MYHLHITETSFLIVNGPLSVAQFKLGMIEHYSDDLAIAWNDKTKTYEIRLSSTAPFTVADHKRTNRNLAALRALANHIVVDQHLKRTAIVAKVSCVSPAPNPSDLAKLWPENRATR